MSDANPLASLQASPALSDATPDVPRTARAQNGAERRRRPRPDEHRVLEQFRRMRGPSNSLRDGDRQPLREHLVMIHAPLVDHCARALTANEDLLEDLMQEGNIGLIKAVDRYDPDKGVRFSTYACHLITGEMRHYLRDLGKMIHEPGWHSELRRQVERAADDLVQKLGRTPSHEEIANALDMQPQIVRKVLESSGTLAVTSLDADDEDDEMPVKPRLYDESDNSTQVLAISVENRVTLGEALPQLRELEKRAVTLFYYGENSKTEVARAMGISVNYAAYLIKKGLEQLRLIIESEAPTHLAEAPLPTTIRWDELARWVEENNTSLSRSRNAAYDVLASSNGAANGDTNGGAKGGSNGAAKTVDAGENADVVSDVVSNVAADTSAVEAPIEYSMLLFRISNWREVTARFDQALCQESDRLVMALTRRSCRKADKVVAVEAAPFGGLVLVALVNGGEIVGQRVRERWMKACEASKITPENAALEAPLERQFASATAPHNGFSALELMQFLESRARNE